VKKRIVVFSFLVLSAVIHIYGQQSDYLLAGKVSFVTAQNIYVKFASTDKIHIGDTIYSQSENKLVPLFTVENLSSISCVGKVIGKPDVKVDQDVVAKVHDKIEVAKPREGKVDEVPVIPVVKLSAADSISKAKALANKRVQNIQGSFLVSSYSNLSNTAIANSQRMRYNFSFRANNLGNSRFSAESYISFSHQLKKWSEVQANVFSALKIYSLAVKYDITNKTNIWVGRRINQNLSNIGAVDGLQAETRIGQFTMGAVAGSRPNDADYNFNFKLLEYGAFIGHNVSTKTGQMQSSFAFFEQKNNGMTDRRFVYFQHDNSLLKNLYFFTSAELDLYKVVEGVPKNSPTLTSLYLSLRYKMFKKLSLYASYDARKNVIYYETYKGIADRLLDEATRQGLQLKINYRPGNQVSMGVNAGYRFRQGDLNPNENINGFITVNQLPWIKTSATLTANLLKTSYLDGKIYGIRLSKDLVRGKLYSEFNYRYVDYSFMNSTSKLTQNIAQLNLSWQFKFKMSVSVDYELTLEGADKYHRIYLSFSKRF
jgi:hypothetical protein